MRKLITGFLIVCLAAIPLFAQTRQVMLAQAVGATLYYGYGCNGTTTNTCTVGGTTGSGATFAAGIGITTGSNAKGYTVQACARDFNGSFAGNFICGVYDNAGTSNGIINCVAVAAVAQASGWTENKNFSGCSLAASTTYKIVFQMSNAGVVSELQDALGTGYFSAMTYPTWNSNVTWSTQAVSRSAYIRVTAN